jgi:aspartokinase
LGLRIHKYGGTSVEGPERIHAVARRIAADAAAGHRVLVVVSAAGRTTDELIRLAHEVTPEPPRREMDMLLTAGERVSMALLAMALQRLGVPAVSFTGSQSGIITDQRHQEARIQRIRPLRIVRELERGRVVIVAGFQGVSEAKEVTTLGRGGSDTTAVALGIVFGAPWCGIYTDVPGILSADPRWVPEARRAARLEPETVLLLSHLGAKVVSRRAAALAARFRLPLLVAAAHGEGPGTWILPRALQIPPPDPPGWRVEVREVDGLETRPFVSITHTGPVWRLRCPRARAPELLGRLGENHRLLHFWEAGEETVSLWEGPAPDGLPGVDTPLALVSAVHDGPGPGPGELLAVREALEREGIAVAGLFTMATAACCLVGADDATRAVRTLHRLLVERKEPGGK